MMGYSLIQRGVLQSCVITNWRRRLGWRRLGWRRVRRRTKARLRTELSARIWAMIWARLEMGHRRVIRPWWRGICKSIDSLTVLLHIIACVIRCVIFRVIAFARMKITRPLWRGILRLLLIMRLRCAVG